MSRQTNNTVLRPSFRCMNQIGPQLAEYLTLISYRMKWNAVVISASRSSSNYYRGVPSSSSSRLKSHEPSRLVAHRAPLRGKTIDALGVGPTEV